MYFTHEIDEAQTFTDYSVAADIAAALDEEGYDARVVAFANDYGIEVREQDMGDRLGWLARYE